MLDPRSAPHPLAGVDGIKGKYVGHYEQAFSSDAPARLDARNEAAYEEIAEADARTYEYRVKETSVFGNQTLGKEFEKFRNQTNDSDMEEMRDVRETERVKQEVREGPISTAKDGRAGRGGERIDLPPPPGVEGVRRTPVKREDESPVEKTLFNSHKDVRVVMLVSDSLLMRDRSPVTIGRSCPATGEPTPTGSSTRRTTPSSRNQMRTRTAMTRRSATSRSRLSANSCRRST